MSNTEKLTVTIKAHGGHDATWLVIKADSVAEMTDLLDGVANSGISAMVGSAVQAFRAEEMLGSMLGARPVDHPGSYQGGGQAAPQGGYNAPQGAPQGGGSPTPYGDAPTCPHGTKKFLEKPYKNGKPGTWKAWACPAPQGDPSACQLEFIRGK